MIRPGTRKAIRGMAHNASRTRKKSWLSCGVFLVGVAAGYAVLTWALWELVT